MPRKSPQMRQASSLRRIFWSIRAWSRSSAESHFSARAPSFGPKSTPAWARRSAIKSLFAWLWDTACVVLLEEPADRVLIQLLHREQAGGPVNFHVAEQFAKRILDLGKGRFRDHLRFRRIFVGSAHGG